MQNRRLAAAIASTLTYAATRPAAPVAPSALDLARDPYAGTIPPAEPAPVLGADLMAPATDAELEAKIEAAKPTAPRLTGDQVQAVIVDETYTRLEGTNTTVCHLTLANGFTVAGVNTGPVSAANFDQEIGCQYAYKAAVSQVWTLEGYLLAERLFRAAVEDEKVEKLRNLVAIQTAEGTVDQGEYMRGMANGLVLALSVFTGQDPAFVEAPKLNHQERVVLERAELDARYNKLEEFMNGEIYPTLDVGERVRLLDQHAAMGDYLRVLADRIAAF